MARLVSLRALNRSSQVRVVDRNGFKRKLKTDTDTVVDLDLASNRRELGRHGALGQYIVTGVGVGNIT